MRTGTSQILFGFFAALFVASQANIIAHLGPVAGDLFSLQLTVSPEKFRSILDGWTAEELTRYRSHFAWDSVHPLIYGGLLGLWTVVVHRQRPFSARAMRLLLVLALAPSVLDYIENAFHIYLESNRESINAGTVLIAGSVASLKWCCAGLITVLLVLASVRALVGDRSPQARTAPAKAKVSAARPVASRSERVKSGSNPEPARSQVSRPEPESSAKVTGGVEAKAAPEAETAPKPGSRKKNARRSGTGS